ncbi:unnamed protein product [Dovyalis caffra]|uniref:RING-type domain-containing protein n=1 Tax=Dovyalis caffra TaxID=77055 RepID=A0AAV1RGS1_9ROSI|nr:unnamed protein product [Dovyalis caffra]
MPLLPYVELYIREDTSILPANQTPPWPKAFFIKFSVNRFVNIYHSEGLIQNYDGETANFCLCFHPVEVGSLYNTFYHPMQDFISRDGAAEFFNDMLDTFEVKVSVNQSIFDNFFSKMSSMAYNARAYDRKIVPVIVEIKVDVWEEFHPGSFEFCIPNYVDEIMRKGSVNCVCHSSLQVLKRPKPDSSSKEQCPICLAIMDGEQEALQLPCSHIYHCDCILTWLRNNSSCPLCRYHIE